jgi:WD40 repeat protein
MARKKRKIRKTALSPVDVPPGFTLLHTLQGHEDSIGRLAWSPNGKFLATPSKDKSIRIWDAESGEYLRDLRGHTGWVYCVSWSPDGRTLASASDDTTIRIWDADSGRHHRTLNGHTVSFFSVSWSPEGQALAAGANNRIIYIWDAEASQLLRTLETPLSSILSVSWSPDGRSLVAGGDLGIISWDFKPDDRHHLLGDLGGRGSPAYSVSCSPDGSILASTSSDSTVRIWNRSTRQVLRTLEGHTASVFCVSWSPDGRLLASKSDDGTIRLWRIDTWDPVAVFNVPQSDYFLAGFAFHPSRSVLATLSEYDRVVRIWDLDIDTILYHSPVKRSKQYTSAKVVLVGDSNVGKSWLATRLVERRCPKADEIGTTHGMKIWKQKTADFQPGAAPNTDEERELVFWDLGGQDEYRLIHQMFLHDTTLALVLIDPTRGKAERDQAQEWNLRLMKQLVSRPAVKLLVGAKVDDDTKAALIDQAEIQRLCQECKFAGFYDVSAVTNRKVDILREEIVAKIDWTLGQTSRSELFQRILEEVDDRQKRGEVVVLLDDLNRSIRDKYPDIFEEQAAAAVINQLAAQGLLAQTQLKDGDRAVILRGDVVEQYAGSLIVAARESARGAPALQESILGGAELSLPGLSERDRLPKLQERIVLECVAELMIRHGVCFRHEGLLVFPTLFKDPPTAEEAEKLPHSVSLWYDFTGAIDNIYALLVAGLMVLRPFGSGRLAAGKAEFDDPSQGVCGLRLIKRPGGLAHIDLFFGPSTPSSRRDEFTAYVEAHLRRNGVEITEHKAIKCGCGTVIDEPTIQARIADGKADVICPRCETRTPISKGIEGVRERDAHADQKVFALRRQIETMLVQDAKRAKDVIAATAAATAKAGADSAPKPVRILHLSDLHFHAGIEWDSQLRALKQDLYGLPFDRFDHLVVSGDFIDRGDAKAFLPAKEFVSTLREVLGVSSIQQVVLVPGNHDVVDDDDFYLWRSKKDGLKEGEFVPKEGGFLARNPEKWRDRFKPFSEQLYHFLYQQPYPLDPKDQGQAFLNPDTRVQFLAFNSAWEIDQTDRKRSGLLEAAVLAGIDRADAQVKTLPPEKHPLQIAVWHHAMLHVEGMKNVNVVGHLTKAGVKLVLHGDVHQANVAANPFQWSGLAVFGVGAFGARSTDRPESTPRMYQVIELMPGDGLGGFSWARLHIRARPKADGPWESADIWKNPNGEGKVGNVDVDLKSGGPRKGRR